MPAAPRRLPPAVADIIQAAEWYDDQQPGLGDDFAREVDAVIESCQRILSRTAFNLPMFDAPG